MAVKPEVEVLGLKELRRDLICLDQDYFPPKFVEAGQKVADPVASRIRSALPQISGDLAGSVRVAKVRTGATIRVGSASVPYAGPTEFGGYPGARPFVRGGRYIFPTAQGQAAKAAEEYGRAVQEAIDSYPWEVPR